MVVAYGARKSPFIGSLESLRGIAALIVVLYHGYFLSPLYGLNVVRGGWILVDFFFVLSGFIIAYGYEKRLTSGDGATYVDFLLLRTGRLYPVHFVMLMAFAAYDIIRHFALPGGRVVDTIPAFLANLTLTQSIGFFSDFTFNPVSWSISTEYYTYLIFAGLVFALRSRARFAYPVLALAAFAVLLILGIKHLEAPFRFEMVRCVLGFFIGATTYSIVSATSKKLSDARVKYLQLFWAVTCASFLLLRGPTSYDFVALPVFAGLVASFGYGRGTAIEKFMDGGFFRWLGKISYSLYMVHFFIGVILVQIGKKVFHTPIIHAPEGNEVLQLRPLVGVGVVLLYVGLALMAAAISYRWLEVPGRAWAKNLVKQRKLRHDTAILAASCAE